MPSSLRKPGLERESPTAGPLLALRSTRPSILEPFLKKEPELGACCCVPSVLVLYVENRPVSLIQSTYLDLPSLESWLLRVRSRYPRRVPAPRVRPKRRRQVYAS